MHPGYDDFLYIFQSPGYSHCLSFTVLVVPHCVFFIALVIPGLHSFSFTCRRQKDLTASLEKERGLERARTQLELDWQRRFEEAERIGFEKQEELVTSLTQAKDEVQRH